ncbi:MAG: hypothetical protein QM572_13795 [Nocardioides sp.]
MMTASCRGDARRVGRIGDRVPEHLAQHRQVPRDHGYAGRERLHRGEAEALLGGDHRQGRRLRHERGQVLLREHADDPRRDAELRGPRVEGGAIVAVVEERLAPAEDELEIRMGRPQQGERLEQVDRGLAGLDAAEREHIRAELAPPARPPGDVLGAAGEARGVDTVGDDRGSQAPPLLDLARDGRGDADPGDRLHHGAVVAGGELRRRELVEVVDRPDTREGGIRGDAVLRVHDVVAPARGGERRPEHVDRAPDPCPDLLALHVGERHRAYADSRVDRPEEGLVAAAGERPDIDLDAETRERLGERERVDHPAPRTGGVGEQRDLHDVPPGRV